MPLDDDSVVHPTGFWSYVHKDNDSQHDRILNLAKLLKQEYEFLTGSSLDLFVDREDLAWGKKWRVTIDDALTATSFLIAIVTPRFLASEECRRELLIFAANAEAREVPELLLPILYAKVDDLVEDSKDEVRRVIAGSQYVDFTKLRVKDQQGEDYLTAVAGLAERLVEISAEVANRPEYLPGKLERDSDPKAPSSDDDDDDDDDSLGILDAIAAQEELFPEWQATIEKYGALMGQVTEVTNKYGPLMTAAGKKNAAARLFVARQYANELTPVADEFKENGSKYAEQAFTMNGLMSVILTNISERNANDRNDPQVQGFLDGARSLATAGRVSIESVQGFQDTVKDVAKMSRDVRKPLKTLSQGAQSFLDGQQLFDDWVRRIDKIELQNEQAQVIDEHEALPESLDHKKERNEDK
ncbi:toll/interleukin-1 receptor domain-containing protein [Rhodococcus sp. G-MC3]|uniref:toll/interleukin-1 receptor domain-containing protein n=1 Tax=Rhodococcus sp. G-MC3 TaxID=3046209 RepID=UPI0024BB5CB7|nr:toll/interleukin-1 receptor domain-containing protein [Rhodococcus sp. G-MC3]MDJ0395905.1 toll/interleukin-1 receptor domain-containing protein [Rhodococcus sp. G-MC3]